ncbi:decarboxylase iboD-like [Nymphaea colorata]|uniref:decarboxylase iboD-like n=1 Tax=Nymphaea colorata TaxID=210225 RepID=UPI00129DA684|nr:decarboxylase iboD-like [Nymphaea colorata]
MTLGGKSGDDVLRLINSACQSPPCFSLHPLVGFPINAIFVEFMQTQNGRAFFADREVNAALKPVLDDYNRMLQSPASLAFMTPTRPAAGSEVQAGGEGGRSGVPEGVPRENTIVSSCESTPLLSPLQPQTNVRKTDRFWLKDQVYSLADMFGADREDLASLFEGGTVYQAFLSALFYHRWHSPVDGVVEDVYDIAGTYYLDQSEALPYDEASPT